MPATRPGSTNGAARPSMTDARPSTRTPPARAAQRGESRAMAGPGITVYGSGYDEALLFRELAPRFGVTPTISAEAVSPFNVDLAAGNRCISVGHKTPVTIPILRALR